MQKDTNEKLLRQIPNVHDCLAALTESKALAGVPLLRIKRCTQAYLQEIRQAIFKGSDVSSLLADSDLLVNNLIEFILEFHQPKFQRIINGTGVIIHTNLGRSILPPSTMDALYSAGMRYSNLEFNLESGQRGSRYALVEELLCELTGAEAALVVNNNAAAVLIALETLAKNKEVIVSRGQLVEIGGSFRIPDIMAKSGAKLVEVGATNRTHLHDYQAALSQETGLLLKVHCSNYRIIGFTCEVSNDALVALAKQATLPVMEDLGSGCFVDLSQFGLMKEPTVQEVVQSGVDIITFSGDKLLGGPQAGIIIGGKKYIEQIKRNPLNRALRVDKFTLCGLESILRYYLDDTTALEKIPTLAMIAAPVAAVEIRAKEFMATSALKLKDLCSMELVKVSSRVGGGAMPEQKIESVAVSVVPRQVKVSRLERLLRHAPVPVVGRVEEDRLLLDMRTITDDELDHLRQSLSFSLLESTTALRL